MITCSSRVAHCADRRYAGEQLPRAYGAHILEVGCGTGQTTRLLAKRDLFGKTRYFDLLLTYSNVQAIAPSSRERFLADIALVIDEHGGQVERFCESVLLSAVRLE